MRRLIFIYLVAASLPIGIFPNENLLAEYGIDRIFIPIIRAVKQGNFELLSSALYGSQGEWLRYMGIWLVLQERLETLCWRVFLRKMYPNKIPLLNMSG